MKKKSARFAALTGARHLTLFFLLFIFSGYPANAQDILKLKSGKELKVIVIEENDNTIKYREFENQSGPVFSVKKENVESVKYKNGKSPQAAKENVQVKDTTKAPADPVKTSGPPQLTAKKRVLYLDGVAQSPRSIRFLMEDQPEAFNNYETGKRFFRASNACPFIIMGITLFASSKMNDMEEQSDKLKFGIPVLCIDAGLIVAGIILSSKGKAKLQKSVSLYNESINKPVKTSLIIGLQDHGVGMSLKF